MRHYRSLHIKESNEKEEWFDKRTNLHISLVQKYIDKIINNPVGNDLDKNILIKQKETHDESKLREPEKTPYIDITWNYKLKDDGKEVDLTDEQKDFQNEATNHHIKSNKHHPEYWDKNFVSVPRNDRDSKTVEKPTDATKMPLDYISIMVADWMAMSEEKGTNPYDWAKDNINKRWNFTSDQEKFIYEILNAVWDK